MLSVVPFRKISLYATGTSKTVSGAQVRAVSVLFFNTCQQLNLLQAVSKEVGAASLLSLHKALHHLRMNQAYDIYFTESFRFLILFKF